MTCQKDATPVRSQRWPLSGPAESENQRFNAEPNEHSKRLGEISFSPCLAEIRRVNPESASRAVAQKSRFCWLMR